MKPKNEQARLRAESATPRQARVKRRDLRSAYVAVVRTFLGAAAAPPPTALGRWLEEVGMTPAELAVLGGEAQTDAADGAQPPWRAEAIEALLREYRLVRRARVRRQAMRGLLRLH